MLGIVGIFIKHQILREHRKLLWKNYVVSRTKMILKQMLIIFVIKKVFEAL